MTEAERRKKIKEFVEFWKTRSKTEKQDDQTFWNMFLRDVLNVQNPEKYISYQVPTDSNKTYWIDAYIKNTGVIIEQKSSGVNLLEKTKQSDGSYRNAFEQAKNYDNNMNKSNKANWIVTSNFDKFMIYDMDNIKNKYIEINLEDLPQCYDIFSFLINRDAPVQDKETTVSKEAGKIIGNIYEEIEKILIDSNEDTEENYKYLNEFCVRLVFCFFAEDSNLFLKKQFRNFIEKSDINHLQSDLIALFETLDTDYKYRSAFLRDDLKGFPFVNGQLFSDKIQIPPLNEAIKKLIVEDACNFDWSSINPTIFGSIFESTLNPEKRKKGGMHYTSIENIHKVIDPLFLDELKKEFSDIRKSPKSYKKKERLNELQNKISSLTFLDPACGSGNFLTETYLELRRIENNIIRERINLDSGQRELFGIDSGDLIKVHIQQFYGIEINDFAVAVSQVAMWIAEYQMYLETEDIYTGEMEPFLPLDSYDNIIKGNALKIEWNDVISNKNCNYIMGNPPFIGSSNTDCRDEQKEDMKIIFSGVKGYGKLDYVSAWYKKSAVYIQNTKIKCAFVSTNSITKGEQVSLLWKLLFNDYNIDINFAYKSFDWTSESNKKAGVVCVIIGFSLKGLIDKKIIFSNGKQKIVNHINGYLSDSDDFYIKSRGRTKNSNIPNIIQGNKPWDGGNLILNSQEYDTLTNKYPEAKKYIKRYVGGNELIYNKKRYCLWLKNVDPNEYRKIPEIMQRIKQVAEERRKTKTKSVQLQAATPMLFSQIRQPDNNYIAIPEVTSNNRQYLPISILNKEMIASNKIFMIPNIDLTLLGILLSNVHMSWMKMVTGRRGKGYSYSPAVYNNFPWPNPTKEQKEKIEKTAQLILDVRAKYPDSSLADLYDESTMPPDLRKAHEENDKAVMKAYGFSNNLTESEIVTELMKMYQKLTEENKD